MQTFRSTSNGSISIFIRVRTASGLARISHTSEAIARRYPEFESEIKVLQEFGSCPEGNSLFFALPIRYRACAPSI